MAVYPTPQRWPRPPQRLFFGRAQYGECYWLFDLAIGSPFGAVYHSPSQAISFLEVFVRHTCQSLSSENDPTTFCMCVCVYTLSILFTLCCQESRVHQKVGRRLLRAVPRQITSALHADLLWSMGYTGQGVKVCCVALCVCVHYVYGDYCRWLCLTLVLLVIILTSEMFVTAQTGQTRRH